MPPKSKDGQGDGILEHLEEIAGSTKFVKPIAAAEKVVEELGEKRLEKFKRCKVRLLHCSARCCCKENAGAWHPAPPSHPRASPRVLDGRFMDGLIDVSLHGYRPLRRRRATLKAPRWKLRPSSPPSVTCL
jgi:hypothetical protein